MMKLFRRVLVNMIVKSIIKAEGRENIRQSIRSERGHVWIEDVDCENYVNDGMNNILGFNSYDIQGKLLKKVMF